MCINPWPMLACLRINSHQNQAFICIYTVYTPPLWTDLVKMLTIKLRHASSFSLECTDFKNVIFENIHWAHSEDAEVAEVKRPRNPK